MEQTLASLNEQRIKEKKALTFLLITIVFLACCTVAAFALLIIRRNDKSTNMNSILYMIPLIIPMLSGVAHKKKKSIKEIDAQIKNLQQEN